MADQKYYNMNRKSEDTRYKVNNNILRMMQTNPNLGMGYIIGNAIGENYWGRKRAKSEQKADTEYLARFGLKRDENGNIVAAGTEPTENSNAIGVDANGIRGVHGAAPTNSEWASRNAALDAYRNGGIGVDANGVYGVPRTPQQSNTSGVTMNNNGGIRSVEDAWRDMTNNSGYNPGNATLYTNGVRNMNNVIPGSVAGPAIGADASGVYGVPGANPGVVVDTARGIYPGAVSAGSAPSADNIPRSPQTAAPNPNPTPIPYTPEQLQQIKDYGGFTPEELQRMGAGELNAPKPESSSGGSGLLGSVVNAAVNAATQEQAPVPAAQNPAPTADQMRAIKGDNTVAVDDSYYNWDNPANTPSLRTRAGANAVINNGYAGYGHDPSLEWHPFATQPTQSDLAAREMALKWLQENS